MIGFNEETKIFVDSKRFSSSAVLNHFIMIADKKANETSGEV